MTKHEVDVAIAGGGPAGMLLGLLLARQGVRSLVLERQKGFAREYRGEVLMPRFSQTLQQLGLFERVTAGTHRRFDAAEIHYGARRVASLPSKRVCREFPFASRCAPRSPLAPMAASQRCAVSVASTLSTSSTRST